MTFHPETDQPALYTLAALYFEEDWSDFHADWKAAVDAFVRGQPRLAGRLAAEISQLLASTPDESELAAWFEQVDLLYEPAAEGLTRRAWLKSVAQRVEAMLETS